MPYPPCITHGVIACTSTHINTHTHALHTAYDTRIVAGMGALPRPESGLLSNTQ